MGTCAWEINLQRSNADSEDRRVDVVAPLATFVAEGDIGELAALARKFVPFS